MARKEIPEKHAPERTISPATSNVRQTQSANPQQFPVTDGVATYPTNMTAALHVVEPTSFDELQAFFTTDLGWTWQPAETAVESSMEGGALDPPWLTTMFQQ